jgi:hypothetical protein
MGDDSFSVSDDANRSAISEEEDLTEQLFQKQQPWRRRINSSKQYQEVTAAFEEEEDSTINPVPEATAAERSPASWLPRQVTPEKQQGVKAYLQWERSSTWSSTASLPLGSWICILKTVIGLIDKYSSVRL